MLEDEVQPVERLRSRRTSARIWLRAAVGATPALALAVFTSAPLGVFLGALALGLIPAVLAPITIWAEAQRSDPGWVARRAALVAHAVATVALLAIPLQASYTATALEQGPHVALDALLASLSGTSVWDLIVPGLVALAIGASLGGQAGERVLARARGLTPWEARARIQDGALARTLGWCLALGGAAVAVWLTRAPSREASSLLAAASIWLILTLLTGTLLAFVGGVVSRIVLVVDVACDAVTDRLVGRAEGPAAPPDVTR